jgi:hypothetical protein
MDDIIILFHKMIVDLGSFNQSHFGIFNDSEREQLTKMFVEQCESSPFRFLSLLSPEQKQHVTAWACQRTSFSVEQLTTSLKQFTKYLDGVKYTVYPRAAKTLKKIKKKSII